MAVTLPYEFDTAALAVNILKGFFAGGALMLLLALGMLIKYGPLAVVPFTLAAILLAWVGRKSMGQYAQRAKGVVTHDAVIVEPKALGPLRLPGLEGRYPLNRFKAVRLIYLGPNKNTIASHLFAEIYLIDRDSTADVCVAFERDTTAKQIAPEIAAAVGLPLEQVGLAPFDH